MIGLRGEKREFEKRDDLVAIIILVFQAYDGGLGCVSVAKLLNRNNIKSLSGKTWSAGTVQRLLRNEAVIGVYQPHVYIRKRKRVPDGQGKIEGYYPEIISPALFCRVQRTLDAKKNYGKDRRNYGGGQKLSAANLVAGIGWCENGHVEAVIPETDTSELMKRVADIEATIARKRQAIELNAAELFELPAGPLREAMKRQLGDAAAEIERHETELQSAREAARMVAYKNSHSSIARFQAAKAKLNSADPEARLTARRKLAQELRLRITEVVLQRDRTIVVRFNDGRGGDNLVDLSFSTKGLNAIRYVREGKSVPIEKTTIQALIEAIGDEKRQPDDLVGAA